MAMDAVRRSSLAALLFLTLVVLAAASGGGDMEKQCHPKADDEPLYMLVAIHNKHGSEEIRLVADQRSAVLLSGVTGFANRSGHWFYSPARARARREAAEGRRRRLAPLLPTTQPRPSPTTRFGGAEGLWNTLVNTTTATAAANDDDDNEQAAAGYMLVGMETGGGDKNRMVVVADQRYFFITGYAQGFSSRPRWFFSDRHLLFPLGGGNGSSSISSSSSHSGGSSSSSHAEVVASSVVAVLMNAGRSRG